MIWKPPPRGLSDIDVSHCPRCGAALRSNCRPGTGASAPVRRAGGGSSLRGGRDSGRAGRGGAARGSRVLAREVERFQEGY